MEVTSFSIGEKAFLKVGERCMPLNDILGFNFFEDQGTPKVTVLLERQEDVTFADEACESLASYIAKNSSPPDDDGDGE